MNPVDRKMIVPSVTATLLMLLSKVSPHPVKLKLQLKARQIRERIRAFYDKIHS